MEGFSYTDIFDTKGIEYLIIIAFLILIIPFWRALNKPIKSRVQEAAGMLTENVLKIPQGLFYGKNHTWAHLEKSGLARIGLDDLLLHAIGQVEMQQLRQPGETIRKGDILAEISQDGKKLRIASPVSGTIQKVNAGLMENPENLNLDPYGEGWLAAIEPENWISETQTLYFASQTTQWVKEEIANLKDFIALSVKKYSTEESQVIMQEGGELRDNPLSGMNGEIWNDFQNQFLSRI